VIWFARRKGIHENEFQSPLSTHPFVQRFISEIEVADSSTKARQPANNRNCPSVAA
jgi:hypothetical protein